MLSFGKYKWNRSIFSRVKVNSYTNWECLLNEYDEHVITLDQICYFESAFKTRSKKFIEHGEIYFKWRIFAIL